MQSSRPREPDAYARLVAQVAQETPNRATLVEIVDELLHAVDGERAFLFRLRAVGGFHVLVARHRDGDDIASPSRRMSHFAVSRMLATGEVWRIDDARQDRRFRTEDAAEGLRPARSIAVYPLNVAGETVGGVYVDHRFQPLDADRIDSAQAENWVSLCALALRVRDQSSRLRRLEKELVGRRGAPANGIVSGARADAARRSRLDGSHEEKRRVFHGLESCNPDMLDLFDTAESLSASDIPVLITGETGTGKGLLAEAIHRSSRRRDAPFVTLSCGAVPESLFDSELLGHARGAFTGAENDRVGLLAQAHGGTFVLDEVGDLSLEEQTKLLRVLEDGRVRPLGAKESFDVDVRILAVTSRDLDALVEQGRFRPDLFYRFGAATLEMPPLRERWEDVPILARSFLRRHSDGGAVPSLGEDAAERLIRYPWPGNVRELENEMRRLAALGVESISIENLSASFKRGSLTAGRDLETLEEVVTSAERAAITNALRVCAGNKSRTAQSLGITRKALYRRLAKYGIESGADETDSFEESEEALESFDRES